jgi:hypothetical protein
METKLFSYKVDGIMLEPSAEKFRLSNSFNRKDLLNEIKELLKQEDFKPDEHTIDYKIVDGQLYIEGLATKIQEPKSIGFMRGN